MRIWKYEIPIADRFELKLPADARVLCVQTQNGTPCVWVLFPVENKEKTEARLFAIYGTGNPMPADPGRYVGTFQTQGGSLVWHLFEFERHTWAKKIALALYLGGGVDGLSPEEQKELDELFRKSKEMEGRGEKWDEYTGDGP